MTGKRVAHFRGPLEWPPDRQFLFWRWWEETRQRRWGAELSLDFQWSTGKTGRWYWPSGLWARRRGNHIHHMATPGRGWPQKQRGWETDFDSQQDKRNIKAKKRWTEEQWRQKRAGDSGSTGNLGIATHYRLLHGVAYQWVSMGWYEKKVKNRGKTTNGNGVVLPWQLSQSCLLFNNSSQRASVSSLQ